MAAPPEKLTMSVQCCAICAKPHRHLKVHRSDPRGLYVICPRKLQRARADGLIAVWVGGKIGYWSNERDILGEGG